jgi:hypothetical protein
MSGDEIAFSSFAPHKLRVLGAEATVKGNRDKSARVDQKCIECRQEETPAWQCGDTIRALGGRERHGGQERIGGEWKIRKPFRRT